MGHFSLFQKNLIPPLAFFCFLIALGFMPYKKVVGASQNISGNQLMKKAEKAYQKSHLDQAISRYGRAAEWYDSMGVEKQYFTARHRQLDILQLLHNKKAEQFDSIWRTFNERTKTYKNGNSIFQVRALYHKAERLKFANEKKANSKALRMIKEARKELKSLQKSYPGDLISINLIQGSILKDLTGNDQGYTKKALALAKQEQNISAEIKADAYFGYAQFLRNQGQRDSAIAVCRKGLNILQNNYNPFHFNTFYLYRLIGKQYGWKLHMEKAKKYYDTAYKVLKRNHLLSTREEVMIQMEYGYYESTVNIRNRKALNHYKRAVNIVEQKDKIKKKSLRIRSYNMLANSLNELGRYQEGINYAKKSLEILDSDALNMSLLPFKVQTYGVLGEIYSSKKAYEDAVSAKKRCLQLLAKYPRPITGMYASFYNTLGEDYMWLSQYQKAKQYVRKSKSFYLKMLDKSKPAIGHDIYYRLAHINFKMDHYDSTFHYLHKASSYNTIGERYNTYGTTPKPEVVINDLYAFMAATLRNLTYRNLYADEQKVKHLEMALTQVEYADTFFQKLRRNVMIGGGSGKIARKTSIVYPDGLMLCHDLIRSDSIDKERKGRLLKKAYRYAEKNRAFVLSGKMTKQDLTKSDQVPDSLVTRLKSLKQKINAYTDSAQMVTKEGEKLAYQNKRLQYLQKKSKLYETLKTKFPRLYKQRFKQDIAPLKQVQTQLRKQDKNLVQFAMGNENLLAVVNTPETTHIVDLQKKDTVKQAIKAFREQLVGEEKAYDQQKAHLLYKRLFKPIDSFFTSDNIVIVPDGLIGYLSFDLLLKDNPEGENYAKLPYLVRDYTFSYAPSATLWLTPDEQADKTNKPRGRKKSLAFTGFAPDFTSGGADTGKLIAAKSYDDTLRSSLAQLPGAKKELAYSAKQWKGQKYMGAKATEARFKQTAADSRILHLATHGIINDRNPYYSKLMFAREADSDEDGALHNYEIYNLDLDADLAVLSACRTGYGKLIDGEGVMSLARGFKIAGCKNILMTQWAVEDRSTAEVVRNFYKNLADGMEKAEALRQAKLTYLKANSKVGNHPFYWGGLVMMGSNARIPKPEKAGFTQWWLIALGGLLLVIVPTGLALQRRAKSKAA